MMQRAQRQRPSSSSSSPLTGDHHHGGSSSALSIHSPRGSTTTTTTGRRKGPRGMRVFVVFLSVFLFIMVCGMMVVIRVANKNQQQLLGGGVAPNKATSDGVTVDMTRVAQAGLQLQAANLQRELLNAKNSNSHTQQQQQDGRFTNFHIPIVRETEPIDDNGREPQYHVIFSTGCSVFQDWQSYIFFYYALKSGQRGNVTRIASGCGPRDAEALRKLHKEQIEIMAPGRFHLHLTPEYSRIKPLIRFKYFNKPFGTRHWMENVLGFPDHASKEVQDTIIILLDPDQILIRPFTNQFRDNEEVWKPTTSAIPKRLKVEHGSPFGQQYGFGLQWYNKVNVTYVAGGPTRLSTIDPKERHDHYQVGPPYIATARDFYPIVSTWCDFCPRVHDEYPHLLAEMFAYCLAAAHLNLPHRIAWGFMVSDPVVRRGEGWKLVTSIPAAEICSQPDLTHPVPHVLHYCQRYMLGAWFISKYRLRKDFISCSAPLMREPPADLALTEKEVITPDGQHLPLRHNDWAVMNAFMLCQLIPKLNEAAVFFKQQHCLVPGDEEQNKKVLQEDGQVNQDDPKNKANMNYNYVLNPNLQRMLQASS